MNPTKTLSFAALSALFIASCAATRPPSELVNARTVYERASNGPAQRLNPADVHIALEQLKIAEVSFKNDGNTLHVRDQAYLALRKAESAEFNAQILQHNQDRDRVVADMHTEQKWALAKTSAELGRTQQQLSAQGVTLQNEQSRRKDAEKRAAQAAIDLAKFAQVKQEPRGMVITLSGGVLFESAKWQLLPTAQAKLNDVANALTKEDPISKIVVEGHTDSQGTDPYNMDLSQRRAQAVRDYLVTRGIASDRITAQGLGSSKGIADNKSPEGRANNRRVEIVVLQPPT
jgi:outer membrane protein OmpA-like peptidoglycan-associated protein